MTLSELRRLMSPTYWAICAGVVALAVLACWSVLTEPGRANQRAAEAKASGAYSAAGTASAKDALKTTSDAHQRETQIDQATKEAEDEIRAAPEDQRNLVALRRLCLHDAYARDPACRELRRAGAR